MFFQPSKNAEMQLFLDGTLKIIAKVDSNHGGYYLIMASNARKRSKYSSSTLTV